MIDLATALIIVESARATLDEMLSYMEECTDATIDKALLGEFLINLQRDERLIEDFVDGVGKVVVS